ncbi:MAG: hypothetical protein HZA50_08415 [Planctomycetes bacterium]|nr:hypothetical protein [Planctomycetota bacterium]
MKTIALCGLAVLLLAGCNPELDQYNQIELGKALAGRGILTATRTTTAPAGDDRIDSCCDVFVFALPAIRALKQMGVRTDCKGNVIAKFYINHAIEHWVLMQLGFSDWRLEFQVPPNFFHETPSNWQNEYGPNTDDWIRFCTMEGVLDRLSDGLPDGKHNRRLEDENKDTIRECVRIGRIPVNPKRLKAGVLERLSDNKSGLLIDIYKDIDLEGLDVKAIDAGHAEFRLTRDGSSIILLTEVRVPRNNRHILGYLMELDREFSESTRPQEEKRIYEIYDSFQGVQPITLNLLILTGMFMGNKMTPFAGPSLVPESFSGLTQSGFEKTIDFGNGAVAILRNLGNRRIQVEHHFCLVMDPFFLGYLVQFGSKPPAPVVKTTINKIGD